MKKKILAILAALSLLVIGGVAIADDPGNHLANAQALLNQAQAEIDAAIAVPQPTFTKTITETVTPSPTTTTPPPPATTTPPPTTTTPPPTTTTTTPPPPPPVGFPSRAEVLAGARSVPSSGKLSLGGGSYDLRNWSWTTGERFPISGIGPDQAIIGGRYTGTFARTLDWDAMHSGSVVLQRGAGYLVSYDIRGENVPDLYRPRPVTDGNLASQQASRFLLDGAYGTYIRDDAVENDQELTGTINDSLFDGVHMGVSIGQSNKNPQAVTTITNDIFIFRPMPTIVAADGMGHAAFFKQLGAGRVVVRNTLICYTEMDVRGNLERMGRWMPGTYQNVTVVLGPGWTSSQIAAFPAVPAGVTVSTNWSQCDAAANAWRAAHGV